MLQPMSKETQRRLAAIVSADVVGYSRLMGMDEVGTLTAMRAHRAELIDAKIAEHGGRIVKTMGDGLLLEFSSVVNATQCAIEVQEGMAARNEDVAEGERVIFRIGVHVGDIIIEGEDILGDGVNIAARLEALAEPGGVCISSRAHDDVRDKMSIAFDDRGETSLKNIARPVRIWTWPPGPPKPGSMDTPPSIPDTISVVVQPFRIIGNAGDLEYLADGMTEAIVAALSHFNEFSVVEADGTAHPNFALSGTIQLAGKRVRITTQLIDERSGEKRWAQHFDRDLDDIFDLQDEISAIVAAFLGEAIWRESAKELNRREPGTFTANDWTLRAMEHLHRLERTGLTKAREAVDRALVLDADLSLAKMVLGFCLYIQARFGWAQDKDGSLNEALGLAKELLARDDANATVHRLMARTLASQGNIAEALAHADRALQLNPYDSDVLVMYGGVLCDAGRAKEAVGWMEKALRFNPRPPAHYRSFLGAAQFLTGDFESALSNLRRVEGAGGHARFFLAATLIKNGLPVEARAQIEEILSERPGYSLREAAKMFACLTRATDRGMLIDSLRLAGFPE